MKPAKWMLYCLCFPTLWTVLSRKYKLCRVAEMIVSVAVTCCFARRKLNRVQNYFEPTVFEWRRVYQASSRNGNFFSNETIISIPSGWNGKSGVPPKVVENFQWSGAFHLHFTRFNLKFWPNGKRLWVYTCDAGTNTRATTRVHTKYFYRCPCACVSQSWKRHGILSKASKNIWDISFMIVL